MVSTTPSHRPLMTSQIKNMTLQATVTMVSTIVGRRASPDSVERHWVQGFVYTKNPRVIPCGGMHLFTKDNKPFHQGSL